MAERRKMRRRLTVRSLVVGVLVLLTLGVAAVAVAGEFDGLTIGRPAPAVEAASPAPSPPPEATGSPPAPVLACVKAVQHGGAVVEQAAAIVADWAAHVQAMADLQSGRATETETKRTWAETRTRGPQRVADFHADHGDFRRRADGCAGRREAELPAAVAACQHVLRQIDAALAAAQGAVADWSAHLEAMVDRRAGRLDAHAAQLKWLAAYRAAPVNIDKFRAAERVYSAHAPCEPPS